MVTELIEKYIWLMQTLTASGEHGLTLEEISSRYENRYNQLYSRRTFNNHRAAASELFGVDIHCNRSNNRYYVSEDIFDKDASIIWMINTFTVNSLLTLSKERLTGRVSVQDIPSGQKYLTTILQAMEDGKELVIDYGKYTSETSDTLHVQPFALKEHERRWYLVGFCHERAGNSKKNSDKGAWRIYGLDRITALRETDTDFKMPKGFNVDELFSPAYGVFFPKSGQKPVSIKFKVSDEEAHYLRDLPLHQTQRELESNVFEIKVIPNMNLIKEFCKRGDGLEVLEPESVRKQVKDVLKAAAKQYKK